MNTLTSSGFLPHILQPTRITDDSATIIDNIYGNNFANNSTSGNILIQMADHLAQFLIINKEPDKIKPKVIYQRNYDAFDETSFIDDISIQNWNAANFQDTNLKFNDFIWRLESCIDRHAPLKKINKKQLKNKLKPWVSKLILRMIVHRDKLFHKMKLNPQRYKRAYTLFRNRITGELKKAKRDYYNLYFNSNINNMKKTWKGIKDILNLKGKTDQHIFQISSNHNLISDVMRKKLPMFLTIFLLM